MSGLEYAWVVALIVTVGALVPGIVRTVAIRSGGFERTRTMVIAARFALGLGLAGLAVLLVLSVLLVV